MQWRKKKEYVWDRVKGGGQEIFFKCRLFFRLNININKRNRFFYKSNKPAVTGNHSWCSSLDFRVCYKTPNHTQYLDHSCIFQQRNISFPQPSKKDRTLLVYRALCKEEKDLGSNLSSVTIVCAYKVILYLWVCVSPSVNEEIGPDQKIQIYSLQPTEILLWFQNVIVLILLRILFSCQHLNV